MRVTSSLWVAAHIRRCFAAGAFAVVERKGADEAGAIYIRVDMDKDSCKLFLPAPMSAYESGANERKFEAYKKSMIISTAEASEKLAHELKTDPDSWVIAIEDREGRVYLTPDLLV